MKKENKKLNIQKFDRSEIYFKFRDFSLKIKKYTICVASSSNFIMFWFRLAACSSRIIPSLAKCGAHAGRACLPVGSSQSELARGLLVGKGRAGPVNQIVDDGRRVSPKINALSYAVAPVGISYCLVVASHYRNGVSPSIDQIRQACL